METTNSHRLTLLPGERRQLIALAGPGLGLKLLSYDNGSSGLYLTHAEQAQLCHLAEQAGQPELAVILQVAAQEALGEEPANSALVIHARELAREAHAGQIRRSGLPYITHPARVAELLSEDPIARAVAWLHDTLEKTYLTPSLLRRAGYCPAIVDTIVLLTNDKQEPYESYLCRVAQCPLARRVKLSDIRHNLDDSPVPELRERYRTGLHQLGHFQKTRSV
jgi:hypothetical protein